MDAEFWRQRWAQGRIGFHRAEVNPRLCQYFDRLRLAPGDRVFVPLCGKSLDLAWLAAQGCAPVGVEISELGVEAFFAEHGIAAATTGCGALTRWQGGGVTIHCGDFFDLGPDAAGSLAAGWDRAALIALPARLRPRYVEHCAALLPGGARVLLVTMAYADAGVEGPPFSVAPDEVASVCAPWFDVATLEADVPGEAPGEVAAQGVAATRESVWLLARNERPASTQYSTEESRP